MVLPEMEPSSVSASLSSDASSVSVSGKRKFEGCKCEPVAIREISLPYRPRPEDVTISLDSNVLTLRLARGRDAKTAAPVPLSVTIAPKESPEEASSGEKTRPIRFVPHASATATTEDAPVGSSVEAQEKSALDSFRAAAQAALAVAHVETRATENQSAAAAGAPTANESVHNNA